MVITGKDSISLQVLEAFTKKHKLADIVANFNLSLDQVKRLKRLYNYTNVVQELTNERASSAFKELGTKELFLSPYIKAKDAFALVDVLLHGISCFSLNYIGEKWSIIRREVLLKYYC